MIPIFPPLLLLSLRHAINVPGSAKTVSPSLPCLCITLAAIHTKYRASARVWLCRRETPQRLALYYMLAGQEGVASCVPLSRDARGFHSVTLRPSASSGIFRASVAYDVSVRRHVETTVTLHSGIQVMRRT